MPLYKFTIALRDQVKSITGVREISTHDIDTVYRTYKLKAETQYSEYRISSFDSKLSEEGKKFFDAEKEAAIVSWRYLAF
jgi:hypothetical protein